MRPTETKKVITEARKVKVLSQSEIKPIKTGIQLLGWRLNMWKS
jgi:hypothetical protein